MEDVGRQALIEAVLEALEADDDAIGITARELAREVNVSIDVIREALRQIRAEGGLQVVKVRRRRIDGIVTWVPAYRLKK